MVNEQSCHGLCLLGTPGLIFLYTSGREETALLGCLFLHALCFLGNAGSASVTSSSKCCKLLICWKWGENMLPGIASPAHGWLVLDVGSLVRFLSIPEPPVSKDFGVVAKLVTSEQS